MNLDDVLVVILDTTSLEQKKSNLSSLEIGWDWP